MIDYVPPDDESCYPAPKSLEILDVTEKKFYTLMDGKYLIRDISQRFNAGWVKHTLAADGEFVYVMYESAGDRIHIMCNLVTKEFHHVVPAPDIRFKYDGDIVVLSVDKATQKYRIVVVEAVDIFDPLKEEGVYVYDSAWVRICGLPKDPDDYPDDKTMFACSSVFFKGIFYTWFVDLYTAPWCHRLCSCDLETGEWSSYSMRLPQPDHPQDKAQLVVCLDRLFFVEYTGLPVARGSKCERWVATRWVRRKHVIKLAIWEILLDEEEVKKVAEMSKFSKYPRNMLEKVNGTDFVAVGCGDSIVISSVLGRHVGWDLSRSCWYELPGSTDHLSGNDRGGIFASLVDF
jgi:hypothetical protein